LWASDERDRERGFCLRVLLRDADGLTLLEHTLPDEGARYPDLSTIFPVANRMQRAAFDLVGVQCDADDQRPWAWQAAWPIDRFPLRRDFEPSPKWEPGQEDYPFVRVAGDGVHEIAVGPVHAGIIEPGHFRFQVVGEKVLRLEERLGYTHKGIEKRFETLPIVDGHRLAGRVSGDSTVAYAWAYAQALEAIAGVAVPPRAAWLRALCLERERVANHLGDLGYLGNDGGFAFGLAQFSRLKEDVLRLNGRAFGHRLLMDVIVPGGVAHDLAVDAATGMRTQCKSLAREITVLRGIYDEHAGLQDRFRTCGRVTRELAVQLGLTGFAGRASGLDDDLRVDFPTPPYDALAVRKMTHADGDVAARVAVRFDEALESLRMIDAVLDALPGGEISAPLPEIPDSRLALGCVEGWRGPVTIALESGAGGTIRRCHAHDPSWQNWPVLEHAVIGNIVPDFPLINKSFNLSYSGHDL
jgi:Ni,Fe-hydrogenase III large subunit